MEHPFFPTTTNRAEAIQYLSVAEKLLSSRDLINSKSFATRARDSDPSLRQPELILAVVDTLLAFDRRIGNNQPDWYTVLRLPPPQPNLNISTLLTNQYRNLVLLLNPQVNKYPFADQAYRIVMDAYGVISDPVRKTMYDKELAFYLQQQNRPDPFSPSLPTMQQNFVLFGGAAAASSGLSQFAQVQQVQQPRVVESVGMGSNVTFGTSSGANFMFGSGSGSGSGWVPSREPVQQESFQGFGSGNMGHAANEPNIGRLNTDDRQRQQVHESFMFNSNAGGSRNVNASGGRNADYVNVGTNGNDVNLNGSFSSRNGNYVHVNESVHGGNNNNNNGGNNGVNVSQNVREDGERVDVEDEEENVEKPVDEEVGDGDDEPTFWTACPYCFYMYEYPSKYVDCTLRCQTCKVAFQAVVIPSPPPVEDGQDAYFCCWGFFPLGISQEYWEKVPGVSSAWTPFSSMYTAPANGGNTKVGARKDWVYIDDDEALEDSDSEEFDDIDWSRVNENKKVVRIPNKNAKRLRVSKKHVNGKERVASPDGVGNARRQPVRAARSSGKLDLNEMSKEAEEPAARANPRNGPAGGENENAEGGFFEGLDDFLSSIPILNCDGSDDKAVKVA